MRQEFSIVARYGKKGKVYYVRYFRDNLMIPSQWSTRTADYHEAEVFARENREKILTRYFNRREGKVLYTILPTYYAKDSAYLVIDAARGRKINENSRRILRGFIVNTFIPFLKKNKIKEFNQIGPVVMSRFQNFLLIEKGLLPQSINRQIGGIKAIFSHLFMTGVIEQNIIKDITPLRTMNNKIRGCYSLEDLYGIFKTVWQDKKSYLLCSLIYSAGLRNGEIQNLRVKDIIIREDVHFLNIARSKTVSGIRIIPLHPKVLDSLDEWVREKRLGGEDYLFVKHQAQRIFKTAKKANIIMGSLLARARSNWRAKTSPFIQEGIFTKQC